MGPLNFLMKLSWKMLSPESEESGDSSNSKFTPPGKKWDDWLSPLSSKFQWVAKLGCKAQDDSPYACLHQTSKSNHQVSFSKYKNCKVLNVYEFARQYSSKEHPWMHKECRCEEFCLQTRSLVVKFACLAWRTLLVYTAKNLASFGSYELSLNFFFLAVRPK